MPMYRMTPRQAARARTARVECDAVIAEMQAKRDGDHAKMRRLLIRSYLRAERNARDTLAGLADLARVAAQGE